MQLFVRTLTGKSITLESKEDDPTIKMVKEYIQSKEGISVADQRLIIAGKQLDDNKTVKDYNWNKETCVHLVVKSNKISHQDLVEQLIQMGYKSVEADVTLVSTSDDIFQAIDILLH